MRTYFKSNKTKTGSLLSVSLTPENNGVFVNIVKQTGWDETKKKGSFRDGGKVTVKFNDFEVAGLKIALNTKGESGFYHTSAAGATKGSVKYFEMTKEVNGQSKTYTGFTFYVKKGEEEFKSNLTAEEGADFAAFLGYAQEKFFDAAIENENARRAKYGNASGAPKKAAAPEVEEDVADEIPF